MKNRRSISIAASVVSIFCLLLGTACGDDDAESAPDGAGVTPSGGTVASGGVFPAGGTSVTGGAFPAGGTLPVGGAMLTGGTMATGGTGGTVATGGVGGLDETGGLSATGGVDAAGGTEPSGGTETGGTGGGEVTVRPPKPEGFAESATGGDGGDVVTAHTGTEIHRAICERATDITPLVILVDGTITPGNTLKQSGSCDTKDGVIELKKISNISLIGVGQNGVLDQVGIHVRESSNIIIQNLTIKNVRKSNTTTPSNGGDAIGMEVDVSRIWIDHNEIHGSTTEGEEHDALIDMKDNTANVTVSYNYLHDSGRGGLIASNDDGDDGSTNITFHHNWYENINSRTQLVREAHGHFYNNYYTQILSTGINCRNGAMLLIEGNYFTNAKNPLGTFYYLDNPGKWEVHDNYFDSSVVWESSSDEIPAGPDVVSTGSVSVPYQYTLDSAQSVPAVVMTNAGVGKI